MLIRTTQVYSRCRSTMTDQKMKQMPLRNGRGLDFSRAPLIMGILNCTPDSFYPSSRAPQTERAIEIGLEMVESGADIIDVGGESTRPGAGRVPDSEEIERVSGAIEGIRARSEVVISVDTQKARVAAEALDAGADLVNDVSGLRDAELTDLVARTGVPVIIMHMRGTPETMQIKPNYHDTVAEILEELHTSVEKAIDAGIALERIIVDPGIGFGKRGVDNLRILANVERFRTIGCPLLIGASRKSFIGESLGRDVERRMAGTLAVNAWAMLHGVEVLRVHDVEETVDLVRMIRAIQGAAA